MAIRSQSKRTRDGADDDQEPSAGTDRGSKRRRSGKEPASTSAPSETTTRTAGKTTSSGSKTHTKSASQSAPVGDAMHSTDVFKEPADQEFDTGVQEEQAEEEVQHLPDWFQKPTRLPSPDHAWNTSVPAAHENVQPWLSSLAQQDPRESFDELTDSTFDFSAFVMNRLNVQTLTPELLAGPTFELMKGTCKSLTELEYFCEEVYKATTEKLGRINPEGVISALYLRLHFTVLVPTSQGRRVYHFFTSSTTTCKYLRGGVSSESTSTSICPWEFALGEKKRDSSMHLLTSKGISSWDVYSKRRYNCSVTRRQFVIQRRVEDLQLGVESYQKKLNLTKPDTYISNLRRQDAYTPYSDPRGFIYENKTRRNDCHAQLTKLHKFRMYGHEPFGRAKCQGKRKSHDPWRLDKRPKDKEDNEEFGENLSRVMDPVTLCTTPSQLLKVRKTLFQNSRRYTHFYRLSHSELVDIEKVALSSSLRSLKSKCTIESRAKKRSSINLIRTLNIRVNSFTMKMEILLEPTSNKLMVEHAEYDESNTYVLERFNTSAGNPVKKILLKLNLSDHRLCKMVVECQSVKVKEFQERCNIKAFQEWYEHVGPEVASPQGGKVTRWRRDCAWLMISRCSRSLCQIQVQGTSSIQEVNDHYNIFTRESQEYELKTKDKA
ncbi:hypothetical protein Tco_1282750 [Tanacetum coccineum]